MSWGLLILVFIKSKKRLPLEPKGKSDAMPLHFYCDRALVCVISLHLQVLFTVTRCFHPNPDTPSWSQGFLAETSFLPREADMVRVQVEISV